MRNLYETLNISASATSLEIKAAYKKLALAYHPDRNPDLPDAEDRFKQINEAYQVLSDPMKKARYDLQMLHQQRYAYTSSYAYTPHYEGSFSGTSEGYTTASAPEPMHTGYSRAQQFADERRGLVWVGLFAIAVVIVSILGYSSYYYWEDYQMSEAQKRRMSLLGKAIKHHQQRHYRESLHELSAIMRERPGDKEVSDFKDRVLRDLRHEAHISFQRKKYRKTIEYLELARQYERMPKLRNFYTIAACFRALNEPHAAIDALSQILADNPDDLRAHMEIALTYHHGLNDAEAAIEYYNEAVSIIIGYYRSAYGDAFAMLVNPKTTSEVHYDVFVGRAEVNLSLGNFDQVIRDCGWAAFLQPKQYRPYLLRGQALKALNQTDEACQYLRQAFLNGSEEALEYASNCTAF